MLEICLLGGFEVRVDSHIIDLPSRRAQSLLAYLIIDPSKSYRRENLAGVFWPDVDEPKARANLRTALWKLRKALGAEHFLSDRVSVTFDANSEYLLDVVTLENDTSSLSSSNDLIRMLSSTTGEFLPGFYDEWVILERDRLEVVFEDRHGTLTDSLAREGRWRELREWAERWIARGKIPEPAYRALMLAYAGLGDRAGIAAVYQRCVEALSNELEVEVSGETQELFERLSKGEKGAAEAYSNIVHDIETGLYHADEALTEVPPFLKAEYQDDENSGPIFVARDKELTKLEGLLEKALASNAQAAFIIGSAGRGKTALAHTFARQAQESYPELLVAKGSCNAYSGIGDPYLPFRDILGMLTGDFEAGLASGAISRSGARRLWTALPTVLQALIYHCPDLIEVFLDGHALEARVDTHTRIKSPWKNDLKAILAKIATKSETIELEQRNFFEQYTRTLQIVMRDHPILLFLDDLQWADAGSIGLLFHLGRRMDRNRIMIMGAFRSEELAAGRGGELHPLEPIVNEFQLIFGDVIIDLGSIEETEGRRFVDLFLDTEPNRLENKFRTALHQQTEGHPLFTVELLRDMQARGDLILDQDEGWIEGPSLDWEKLPSRVETVIEARIARLDGKLQEILKVASVEGEDFTAQVIAHVIGEDVTEIVRLLSGVLEKQHRFVNERGVRRSGEQLIFQYRFRHFLFQKYLYQNLGEVERAHLHEETGNALLELHEVDTGDIAVQLARHFQEAGLHEKAIDYLLHAAKRANRMSANAEVVTHVTRALELLDTFPANSQRDHIELELLMILGPALIGTRGFGAIEVEQVYSRARELCMKLGETTLLFPALRGIWTSVATRDYRSSQELGEELLRVALDVGDNGQLLVAHNSLGYTLSHLGELSLAKEHLKQACVLYDPLIHHTLAYVYGEDFGVASLSELALTMMVLGYPDQALRLCEEALSLAKELSDAHDLAWAFTATSQVNGFRREVVDALGAAEAAISISDEETFPHYFRLASITQGWAFAELGRYREGIKILRQNLDNWTTALGEHSAFKPYILALLAEALWRAGKFDDGINALSEGLESMQITGDQQWEAELYRLRGDLVLAKDGNREEAEKCFLDAIDIAQRQAAKSFELRASTSLCRLWEQQGRRKEARQMLFEICNWFTEGFDTLDYIEAKELLAQVS